MGRPPSNGGQGGFAETDGEGRLVRRWAACNEERFLSASIGSARLRHGDGQVLEVPENSKVLRIFTVTGLPSAPEANSEVVTE